MLRRIDHVNLVVRDLDRMVAFYTRVLGLRETKRVRIAGGWIGKVVGLSDAAADVVYLEPADGPRVELIRYDRPAAIESSHQGRPNTLGLRHLAFDVDDIDARAATLRAEGVHVFSDVQTVPDSQVTYAGGARKRLVYFHDPEGNLLELCEYRAGH